MKVLVCHNRYRIRGGEDTLVDEEIALLRKHGVQVELHQVDSNDIESPVKVAFSVPYSRKAKRDVQRKIQALKPDILHVHNFFPQLTPSIYDAAIAEGVPVIQSLHNYRLICANGLFLRNSRPCELCLKNGPLPGLVFGCYRGSRLATAPVSAMIGTHKFLDTWNKKVNKFLVPTQFGKNKFVEFGIDPDRISVKYNFGVTSQVTVPKTEKYFVYLGRLSEEKGIQVLLDAVKDLPHKIKVVGGGSQPKASNNVEYLGALEHRRAVEILAGAQALVFPSICYEGGFPLAVMEAMAQKIPVIASNLGTIPEFLDESSAYLFTAGNSAELRKKIQEAAENSETSRTEKARGIYEANFTPGKSTAALIKIYEEQRRDSKTSSPERRT
jgi:glycosyltransferase involved in cell wall biosynthesis